MFRTQSHNKPRGKLSDSIYGELVELLFTNLLPIAIIGISIAWIGALITLETEDTALGVLSLLAVLAAIYRASIALAFRSEPRPLAAARARIWERRYAMGSLVFGGLLGLFGGRAIWLTSHTADMLVTALLFGYGAGVVARISIRPWICIPSLILAALPIIAASIWQMTPAYLTQALFLTIFLVGSFESVRHTYLTTLNQLETKREMASLARQDDLTKLPNRLRLRERFAQDIASLRNGELIALHYLDLDHFKQVNDTYGHPVGDTLLISVADRLRAIVRANDTVARLGGDEFVVIQTGISHRDEAEMLSRRIIRSLTAPYEIRGEKIVIGTSVGVAMAPTNGTQLDQVVACADGALYATKKRGRGAFAFCGESSPYSRTASL